VDTKDNPARAFILSLSEVNQYFPNSDGARLAFRAENTSLATGWWTRSPGTAAPVAAIFNTGVRTSNHAIDTSQQLGYRPAVWVRVGN
jgi:hypothetical protein